MHYMCNNTISIIIESSTINPTKMKTRMKLESCLISPLKFFGKNYYGTCEHFH